MSYFMQSGDFFTPTPGRDSVLDALPIGNYIVVATDSGLKFKRTDSFEAPGKMYGRINERASRILATFQDRPRATGVLLEGEKGSGKSQLARNVSYAGYELGIPTILVNQPFCGDAFNALLATIEQPAIVIMDEFEKVYAKQEEQEAVLTLLDGVMTTKKLFILTVNNKFRVNEHMKNRPGRIYYAISFNGLEPEFVKDYCEENLNDQGEIDGVLKVASLFKAFNFDMLKAIVEEMNRYKESAFEVTDLLNAKPIADDAAVTYAATITTPSGLSGTGTVIDLPMANHHNMAYASVALQVTKPQYAKVAKDFDIELDEVESEAKEQGGKLEYNIHFRSHDLRKIDAANGGFEFVNEEGFKITLKRKKAESFGLHDLY